MNKQLFLLATMPILSCSLMSCGTIGGVGKDLQVLGSSMEKAEHKRLFSKNKPATQNGAIDPATLNPDIMNQAYPDYPAQ